MFPLVDSEGQSSVRRKWETSPQTLTSPVTVTDFYLVSHLLPDLEQSSGRVYSYVVIEGSLFHSLLGIRSEPARDHSGTDPGAVSRGDKKSEDVSRLAQTSSVAPVVEVRQEEPWVRRGGGLKHPFTPESPVPSHPARPRAFAFASREGRASPAGTTSSPPPRLRAEPRGAAAAIQPRRPDRRGASPPGAPPSRLPVRRLRRAWAQEAAGPALGGGVGVGRGSLGWDPDTPGPSRSWQVGHVKRRSHWGRSAEPGIPARKGRTPGARRGRGPDGHTAERVRDRRQLKRTEGAPVHTSLQPPARPRRQRLRRAFGSFGEGSRVGLDPPSRGSSGVYKRDPAHTPTLYPGREKMSSVETLDVGKFFVIIS